MWVWFVHSLDNQISNVTCGHGVVTSRVVKSTVNISGSGQCCVGDRFISWYRPSDFVHKGQMLVHVWMAVFANSLTAHSLPNLVLCASIDGRWVLCDQSWCQQVGMTVWQWTKYSTFNSTRSYHCRMECLPTPWVPADGHALQHSKVKVSIFKGHNYILKNHITRILHTLSEQAQGSQNGPPFPRSILNLVLLMLGQLSRRGGKKERRRRRRS